ncbi:hypothetical protein [Pulveribacter sp.]|uniref:hypothetical protein n=1 Tax=Pulveribacter sp. TaxID=2678893 RepID=UPI0028B22F53|nr:hypothetical protein [Pulveribacter sp.]
MFQPADEFDYGEIIGAQLETMLHPLTDSRRGVHMVGHVVSFKVSLPVDVGVLRASLTIEYRDEEAD